jgi:RNA polymerase sigma factor CnrH
VIGQDKLTDRALAKRAVEGDHRAFAVLIGRYKAAIFAFIRRYVGSRDEDAHDLLQQVFLSAWQGLGRYDLERPLGPWLTAIALNKCRDYSRKAKLRRFLQIAWAAGTFDVPDPAPATDLIMDADQELLLLEKAIAMLPRGLKEPLLLTVFEGFSHEQAGLRLGFSSKAIEGRTRRARQELQRQIKAWTDPE